MRWLMSSIGRKQVVGLTGLGLCGFLLTHMAGNMLILVSPQAYNEYSHALITNHLIYVAEIGLLGLFLLHFALATAHTVMGFRGRETQYAVRSNGAKGTSWIQRSLWPQGAVILLFLILHLATFKYGPYYTATYNGVEMRDLHQLVIDVFHQPGYVAWYVFALLILCLHLSHGFGSAFQTLGVNHPRYQRPIRMASLAYAAIITLGFLSQPFYVYFIHN